MGDWYTKLVPKNIKKEEVTAKAQLLRNNLVDRKIISTEMKDNILSDYLGYSPGENCFDILSKESSEYPFLDLVTNGMELVQVRTIFYNTDGPYSLKCPHCQGENIKAGWYPLISSWEENIGQDQLSCLHCLRSTSIAEYQFDPNWAFGNLGLIFWNWPPFKTEFIEGLEDLLGTPIDIVEGKL